MTDEGRGRCHQSTVWDGEEEEDLQEGRSLTHQAELRRISSRKSGTGKPLQEDRIRAYTKA